MIISNATIKRILDAKSGTSATTGKEYCFQPIQIAWGEQKQNFHGETYTIAHETEVTLTGEIAKNFTLGVGDHIIIDLRFHLREYQGRFYSELTSGYVRLQST